MEKVDSFGDYKETFENNEILEGKYFKDIFDISNDTRKFEIDLYWKRSNYFILFIGATLTAYLTVFALTASQDIYNADVILYLLNCVGLISTWTWYLSLKGSKFWQENWEKHVSCSQHAKVGPLFSYVGISEKVPLEYGNFFKKITTASPYSVSKLNMLLSFFILLVWLAVFISISHRNFGNYCLLKLLLFFGTVIFLYVIKKYGSSSFSSEMRKEKYDNALFFKL